MGCERENEINGWRMEFESVLCIIDFSLVLLPFVACLSVCLPIPRSIINEAVNFYNNGHLSKLGI